MRTMIAALLLAPLTIVACRDDNTADTPTPAGTGTVAATETATVPAEPEPTETAESTATVEASPSPGVVLPGDIALAIDAAEVGDRAVLAALLTTVDGPCVVDPRPEPIVPPSCPEGSEAGDLVPATITGWCPDQDLRFIDPAVVSFAETFDARMLGPFIGAVVVDNEPLRYAALFGIERIGWLGFDADGHLIGAGRHQSVSPAGGDCPARRRDVARWPGLARLGPRRP